MKAYAMILHVGLDGEPREKCGSDALIVLDGRSSLETHCYIVLEHMKKMRKFRKDICGFYIYRGCFSLSQHKESNIIKKYIDNDVVAEYQEKYYKGFDDSRLAYKKNTKLENKHG